MGAVLLEVYNVMNVRTDSVWDINDNLLIRGDPIFSPLSLLVRQSVRHHYLDPQLRTCPTGARGYILHPPLPSAAKPLETNHLKPIPNPVLVRLHPHLDNHPPSAGMGELR